MTDQPPLSNVFGASGKAALAGKLTPLSPPTEPLPADIPVQPAAKPVVIPVASAIAVPVAPPVARPRQPAPPGQINVYVLPHVPAAIQADKRGRTNAGVVYDVLDQYAAQLPDLLAARRAGGGAPAVGGASLFTRAPTDVDRSGGRIMWTFKAAEANRAALDQLASRVGALSRSEMISTALEVAYPHSNG